MRAAVQKESNRAKNRHTQQKTRAIKMTTLSFRGEVNAWRLGLRASVVQARCLVQVRLVGSTELLSSKVRLRGHTYRDFARSALRGTGAALCVCAHT